MTITKEEFKKYVNIQMSGITNMFELGLVSSLTGLSKDTIIEIMETYDSLSETYPDVRKI